MSEQGRDVGLSQLRRELAIALEAARQPGMGAVGSLECRVADLQQRLLAGPASSLEDVAIRMEVVCDLVAGLGPRGYLLDLVEQTLTDIRRLAGKSYLHAERPGEGNSA